MFQTGQLLQKGGTRKASSAENRPASLDGVDAVLRPLVEIVVQMAAPVDRDPMITAVK